MKKSAIFSLICSLCIISIYTQVEYQTCLQWLNSNPNLEDGVYELSGYGNKFKVWCNMKAGGETVFQKRIDGTVSYDRTWDEYKNGFGDPDLNSESHGEFWIGLDNIYALSDLEWMTMRIKGVDEDGDFYQNEYINFYIDDASLDYIIHWDYLTYESNLTEEYDCFEESRNTKFSSFDHDTDESLINCAEKRKGGFWYGKNLCGGINLNGVYEADDESSSIYCKGYTGKKFKAFEMVLREEKVNIESLLGSCREYYLKDSSLPSGIYKLFFDNSWSYVSVWCNMELQGQTFFQVRGGDSKIDFEKNWNNYLVGFGYPNDDLWLGLRHLNDLTKNRKIAVFLNGTVKSAVKKNGRTTTEPKSYFAIYHNFKIGDEASGFQISWDSLDEISTLKANGKDCLSSSFNKKFSTYDHDEDDSAIDNCADLHKGGWWFGADSEYSCGLANLNGVYSESAFMSRNTICTAISKVYPIYKISMAYIEEDCNFPGYAGGFEDCKLCEPGWFTNDHKMCRECNTGSITTDHISCSTCPDGEFTEDHITCKTCPDGETTANHDECIPCADGLITSDHKNCERCPVGYITTDHTTCVLCGQGNYTTNNIECLPCALGTITSDHYTCISVDDGHYTDDGETQKLCEEGTASNSNHTGCEVCEDGFIVNNDHSRCISCGIGEISIEHASCIQCEPGFITIDHINCTACPDGEYTIDNEICWPCDDGTITEDHVTCHECTDGFTTADHVTCVMCPEGATSIDNINCTVCPIGFITYDHITCQLCPDGEFTTDHISCSLCPSGTITKDHENCSKVEPGFYTTDHINVLPVPEGYTSPDGENIQICGPGNMTIDRITCEECPAGEITSDHITCIPCESGFITKDHVECSLCGDGMVVSDDNVTCVVCGQGNITSDHIKCEICPDSQITLDHISCSPCKDGEYTIDHESCVACNSSCKSCKGPNANDCLNCYPGTALDETGECKKCPDNCTICEKDKCKECINNYILDEDKCIPDIQPPVNVFEAYFEDLIPLYRIYLEDRYYYTANLNNYRSEEEPELTGFVLKNDGENLKPISKISCKEEKGIQWYTEEDNVPEEVADTCKIKGAVFYVFDSKKLSKELIHFDKFIKEDEPHPVFMVLPEEYPVDYETEDGYKRIGTAGYIIPRIAKYVFEDEDLFTITSVSSSKYLALDLDTNEVMLSEDYNDYWLIHVVDKENNLYKFEYIGYYEPEPAELTKELELQDIGLAETSRKSHRAKSFLGLVEIEDEENTGGEETGNNDGTDTGKNDEADTGNNGGADTGNNGGADTGNNGGADTGNNETPTVKNVTPDTDTEDDATPPPLYLTEKDGKIAITSDEKEAGTTFKAFFDSKSGNIAIKTISNNFLITNNQWELDTFTSAKDNEAALWKTKGFEY